MNYFWTFSIIFILVFFHGQAINSRPIVPLIEVKTSTHYKKTTYDSNQEWRFIWSDDVSKVYLEENSKKAYKKIITLEAMTDYIETSPQWNNFSKKTNGLSEIEKVAFDCSNKKYRSLGGSWFEGHLAKGLIKSIYFEKESWSDIPLYYQKLYEIVCDQASNQHQEKQ